MESKEWKTIISETQLDELVTRGILYKDRDLCYWPVIDKDRWGSASMPSSMVAEIAGETLELTKVEGAQGWRKEQPINWYISPWMLEENYAELIKHGRYKPEPYAKNEDGFGLYKLKIMDFMHLECLVNKGIISKKAVNGMVYYTPNIDAMGDISMPIRMAEQICGKVISCNEGIMSTWVECETGNIWNIAPWMLADNYDYLLDRLKGEPNTESLEPDKGDEEKEEEESPDWNETRLVGYIIEKNTDCITIECYVPSVPVLCYGNADGHGIGEHVKVRGNLRRVNNMMGYPEIDIVHIEEY